MKLLIFSVSAIAFLMQVFLVSAAITVVCTPCQQGNCNCNANTCPSSSGSLSIYKTSDCSGIPVFKVSFTGSAAIWSPDSFGAYYGRALCDDRITKSDCVRIDVSQITSCDNQDCATSCKGQGNVTGSCSSTNVCQCSGIQNECSDGTSYSDCSSEQPKYCTSSGDLTDDCGKCGCPTGLECQSDGTCGTKTTTKTGDSGLGLWIGIFVVIIIAVVAIYFLFLKKKSKGSPKASYENLYRKWSK